MAHHTLTPYIAFNGNCREAMTFYKDCFGGEVNFTTFAQMRDSNPEAKDLIAHAHLQSGDFMLLGSDGRPGHPSKIGENVSLYLKLDTNADVDALYTKLAKGGAATMPPADQPWGSYFGMVTDKYDTHWMLSHEKPR